ncbi:hypothetical protein ACVWXO_007390 [Bradyrhizobium sp. LM2.7]
MRRRSVEIGGEFRWAVILLLVLGICLVEVRRRRST